MSFELRQDADGKILTVKWCGTLTKDDYLRFVPQMERLIEAQGKVRMLFDMHDFHGWKMSAAWEDLKFGLKHFNDIERIAMVGEKAWEHGIAVLWSPFTAAKLRYFDRSRAAEADEWIHADLSTNAASS